MTTGYVYDPIFLEHNLVGHPENRERLVNIMALLEEKGALQGLTQVEATPVAMEQLTGVHSPTYVEQVRRLSERGGGYLDPDTYVSGLTYDAALVAAGGLVNAVLATLHGEIDNAFALVRPPGHHAAKGRGAGFCIFNNVAVAARAALGHKIERVFIADFDVHHGDGTQALFYDDPAVLFFSTHQYPYYPGTGHWSETGQGAGLGMTINVPLPPGVGDGGFGRIYDEVLIPAARRYQPQFILVSAGFDSHWDDPLAGMNLSIQGYADLVRRLVDLAGELCGGRIAFTLEGGYRQEVVPYAVLNALRLLSGHGEVEDPLGPAPGQREQDIDELLAQVKEVHGL
jgi:acetoin utilization deacetylase AcuC-like enzyme